MAIQLPKINLADAKTRVVIIAGGIVAFVIAVYIIVHVLSHKTAAGGASHLAGAPGGLQSVPGGKLTPEYYRALVQANAQAAKQAKISGTSAVPTLLNEAGIQPAFQPAAPSCTVVCPTAENMTVDNDINDLVKAGKLAPKSGQMLSDMAKKNVAVSEYAAVLDKLVGEGQLSPEQARKLLEDYKTQHANALLRVSGQTMDTLIKSGQLPLDVANELLDMQRNKATTADYAAKLTELVNEGKISPETAEKLLAQYTRQHATEQASEAVGQLAEMAATGQIAPDVAKELAEYQQKHVSPQQYNEELQHLVSQGRLTEAQAQRLAALYQQQVPPEVAADLANLQQRNVSLQSYQAELGRLVADGKITPAQAEQLMSQYRDIKTAGIPMGVMNGIVKQAEKENEYAVQQLAESGKISPETEHQLLQLQQAKVPIDEYRRQLDQLVSQGKLSPEDAKRLLMTYMTERGAGVQSLLENGRISPETADKLMRLQQANVPLPQYKNQLEELVKEGKISPADAQRLLNNYAQLEALRGQAPKGGETVQRAAAARKLSPAAEQKLLDMQHANVPVDAYKNQLDALVQEGKISPPQAQKLLSDYTHLQAVREEAARLEGMRTNNVAADQYADELKRAVAEGILTPDQAAELLQEYQASKVKAAAPLPPLPPNLKGTAAFAELQKKVQAAAPAAAPPTPPVTRTQFGAVAAKNKEMEEKAMQDKIQSLMSAMSSQAGELISAWKPPMMSGQVGSAATEEAKKKLEKESAVGTEKGRKGASASSPQSPPLIKAGTIVYAVLDTAINSDYPDSPVLATLVSGPFKGAQLLGKVAITKGQDRVGLTFKLMNREDWNSGKTINAYAIDPETARTALASQVNYHYFLRYGGMFASSFLQGYASAISNSGSTTSSGIFGTTTTKPAYSPTQKIMTGLGQVGQTLGRSTSQLMNTPPTVKIDPGVSLGILFMQDVT